MTSLDDDCPEIVGNMQKARKSYAHLSRILVREGVNTRVVGVFLKAVMQVVLIFGAETWVMNSHMGQELGGVQHILS